MPKTYGDFSGLEQQGKDEAGQRDHRNRRNIAFSVVPSRSISKIPRLSQAHAARALPSIAIPSIPLRKIVTDRDHRPILRLKDQEPLTVKQRKIKQQAPSRRFLQQQTGKERITSFYKTKINPY